MGEVLRAFGVTEKGPVRPVNEDCFAIDEAHRLLVVADGMGGHQAGEVAARIAVETIRHAVGDDKAGVDWPFGFDPAISSAGNLLRTAVQLANLRVLETAESDPQYVGMGTTVVAAVLRGNRLSVAHVGDSRLYLFSARILKQMTRDDSWIAAVLAQDPAADPTAFRHHPMRSALTSVVGRRLPPDVHITEEVLTGATWLALTTDGVHGTLGDHRIERLFKEKRQVEDLASSLVREALAHGSHDNCTAVVAGYEPGEV